MNPEKTIAQFTEAASVLPPPKASQPLRILIDTLPFDHGQSGISEYDRAVIKALEKAGHDVTVLAIPQDAHFFSDNKVVTTPSWAQSASGSIL